jgi:hypothetical protein
MSVKRLPMFVVHRRDGAVMVVVDDAGRTTRISANRIPTKARVEGAVLRVKLDPGGEPLWEDAVRDRGEERRRRAVATKEARRLERGGGGEGGHQS